MLKIIQTGFGSCNFSECHCHSHATCSLLLTLPLPTIIDCQVWQLQSCELSLTIYSLNVLMEMTSNYNAVKGINRYLYERLFHTS